MPLPVAARARRALAAALLGGVAAACGDGAPTGPSAADGLAVVFARTPTDTSGRGGQIFVMRADGSALTALTGTDHNLSPRWSPDGERIAFVSVRTGYQELYVMRADGSGVTRLTSDSTVAGHPSWSPDGRRLAFTSIHHTTSSAGTSWSSEIDVVNVDGTGRARLTNSPLDDITPAWSPDGARIAFVSSRSGRFELYTMRPDGSDVRRLTAESGLAGTGALYPAWSPDGRRIAYASSRTGDQEIYVVGADGANEVRLTTSPARDNEPAWSPDGTRLLFWSTRDGGLPQLYVMNADGTGARRLLTSAAADMSASWRR